MSQHTVVLLLGSNIGDTKYNIDKALEALEQKCTILRKSEYLLSEPVEFASSNIFCNIAVKIKTQFSPFKLLSEIKAIERKMGRTKDSSYFQVYQDRIIDIDIVIFNNLKFISGKLLIPHEKNLYHRDFAREIINNVK